MMVHSHHHRRSCLLIGVVAICLSSVLIMVDAVLPTAELLLMTNSKKNMDVSATLLVSQAFYGPIAPTQKYSSSDVEHDRRRLTTPLAENSLLCFEAATADEGVNQQVVDSTKGTWMVVPRGGCTYEHKTWIAQSLYKAAGVIVYNTLASRYTFNETDNTTIIFPVEYHDYDCNNAKAEIPSNELKFFSSKLEAEEKTNLQTSPYNVKINDPLLAGDTVDNLCKIHDENALRNCPSKRCVVAANKTSNDDTTTVCCAWDLLLNPYPDDTIDKNVTIPTIFATMEQGDIILKAMAKAQGDGSVTVSIHSRWRPGYNVSAVLIVLFGVFVAGFAAFRSANDYQVGISKLWKGMKKGPTRNINSNPASAVGDGNGEDTQQQQESLVTRSNSLADESLELEPMHAVVFLVMSSFSLFILFFFKIYNVAKVMYAFGCANSFIQIMVYPLLSRFLSSRLCRLSSSGKFCFRERCLYRSEEFGDITNWDVLAGIIGYSVGMVWLYMSLCIPQAGEHYTFYWVAQDVLGFCMCVTFLGLIKLNSIKVAATLLIVAFFYDIFFVFVTPYLFKGRSVMIEVATSGGPPKADGLWCEKYPSDSDCKGGDPMPMLFSIPRLFDYQGGASMLGLGDIVLPGLLLSFAARLDAARLVYTLYSKKYGQVDTIPPPMSAWYALLFGGYGYYFVPLMISYAIGLFMANAAVYIMNMGQPALLYIVPMTLGMFAYKGWRRNELVSLWNGPKILGHADLVCYGRPQTSSPPAEGEDEAIATQEEFVDDEAGDVPLISDTSGPSE